MDDLYRCKGSNFLRKSDYLGCAVLLCLVCLFDLACFFLSSLILKMYYQEGDKAKCYVKKPLAYKKLREVH